MMKKGLEDLGYKIFVAVNGKKGFELFKKNSEKIDVIISDIVMPEIDGLQMYEKIKSISNKVKIIFTTGYVEKDISNLKDSQNVLFLNKPYKLSELNEKIREILNR
jgi:two-component system cell cycle sensor histidine kinase/response regulator CckA